ncbi:MAG TPA: hypothetical protein PLC43_06135 [Caldisericia bacterium]|nr:hypothetical protein [Caldisericia bacterium]
MVRRQSGIQNLTIDYSTDTNGRILSAAYTETGGFTGNFTYVYDNYGNIIACKLDYGDMAKAVLINPNNGAIDTRYDPNDIDDPFSYRARDGFMGIGPLLDNNYDGTVYIQGHVVIPNPWGNVSTNGTTTTTTDDTTDKDGGDDAEPCGGEWDPYKRCMYRCFSEGKDALERDKKPGGLGDFSREHKKDNWYKDRFYHWKDAQRNYYTMAGLVGTTFAGIAASAVSGALGIAIAVGAGIGALGFMIAFMSHMSQGELWIQGMDWPTVVQHWTDRENDCRDYCEYLRPDKES